MHIINADTEWYAETWKSKQWAGRSEAINLKKFLKSHIKVFGVALIWLSTIKLTGHSAVGSLKLQHVTIIVFVLTHQKVRQGPAHGPYLWNTIAIWVQGGPIKLFWRQTTIYSTATFTFWRQLTVEFSCNAFNESCSMSFEVRSSAWPVGVSLKGKVTTWPLAEVLTVSPFSVQ